MKTETMFNIRRQAVWRGAGAVLLAAAIALVLLPDLNPLWLVGTAIGTFVCLSMSFVEIGEDDHDQH